MAADRETGRKIEEAALSLFALRGYGSVSIRDICRVVGVRESTVYYHFENKRAILDALLSRIDGIVEAMKAAFNAAFESVRTVSDGEMTAVARGVLTGYLLNPYVHSMMRMLSIERMRDEEAAREYGRLAFELPLSHQQRVFAAMMEKGLIAASDPLVVAEEYYAVIYLAYQEHCACREPGEAELRAAFARIDRGVSDLYRKMKGEIVR